MKQLIHFSTKLIFIIFIIIHYNISFAQTWQKLGPNDYNQPTLFSASYYTFGIDKANTPYVFFSDGHLKYKASVRKYNGSAWEYVGTPGFTVGRISKVSIDFDNNNAPYIAFIDSASNGITVKKFDGNNWINVGNTGFTNTSDFTIKIDNSNTPYVASIDGGNNFKANVKKFNGTSWVNVGSPNISTGRALLISLALDSINTPFVSYCDANNNNKVTVKKLIGSNWVDVGAPGLSLNAASEPKIKLDNSGNPIVAYLSSNGLTVKKFDGTNWNVVGTSGFTVDAERLDLTCSNTDTLYVFYRDAGNNRRATVKKFDGTNWINVGVPGFSSEKVSSISIAIDSHGIPLVGYVNDEMYNARYTGSVKKYNGNSWLDVGDSTLSSGPATSNSFIVANSGIPYLAYVNKKYNKICVIKHNGTDWEYVGNSGVSNGSASGMSLAIDRNDTIYIAYSDFLNQGKLVVKKFDGVNWVNVGSPTISLNGAGFPDLTFDHNNIPYVLYPDGQYLSVKKFDGFNWVYVGTSNGSGSSKSININSNNEVYISYVQLQELIVEKFDGSNWVKQGSLPIATGVASSTPLVIDSNDKIFIGYTLSSTSTNLDSHVKNFRNGYWIDVNSQSLKSINDLAINNDTLYISSKDNTNNRKTNVLKFDGTNWVMVGDSGITASDASYQEIAFSSNKIFLSYNIGGAYVKYFQTGPATGITDIMSKSSQIIAEIFPNPTQSDFYLKLKNLQQKQVKVTLLNPLGQVIESQEVNTTNNGEGYTRFQTSGMVKGLYLVQITDGKKVTSQKVLIQ